MDSVSFEDFKRLDIRIGKVIAAENVEGSEKLLKLQVDFGVEKRQILSGIAKFYAPETIIGKSFPFIVNLAPRMMMGLESQGMILAADNNGEPVLMEPNKEVPLGSMVK